MIQVKDDITDIINKSLTMIGEPISDNIPSIKELRDDPLLFMNTFFDDIARSMSVPQYMMFGADWTKDSGMNRGDIMSRNDNVVEVRFKTVTINT